ncbi:MFS transporter [Homoserinibacter sp. YIM 151385]|uniref:MFS transporter n=1 Tax=Homoserinibacter sp. YIM 151385 TaxID=2985506 RepID=UPI0022F05ECE|nr:MFS transporter [Homoserinibacter sp. YIM 151385]WBU38240.1 MFS transporter [Homoserinibacter sp. YIM 151385]
MPQLSPARTRLALLALALGGFGIGTTEFVAMGLLPEIAQDLLPAVWAASPDQANAQVGILISAYALGVVVGAPTIAATAARFPRKSLLTVLAVAFTAGTILSALAPTFEVAVVARFLAALPHGAYFGIASLVAAQLMGPGRRAQGVALVLSGLTISNVVGVPLVTLLGQTSGWRVAYLAVAAIFAATTVAIILVVPASPGDPAARIARELRAFRRGQVWFALGIGAIGFGGFFAVYSYVSPLTTEVTGLPAPVVPLAVATLGLGMTVGNLLGGRLADRGVVRALLIGFASFIAAMIGLALTASTGPGLFAFLFLVGATSSVLVPAVQTRLMDVAGDAQTLAAALNHSALNIGNGAGAALGAVVIAAGLGYVAPTWVGVVLALLGVALTGVAILVGRLRPRPETGAIATARSVGSALEG